MHDAECPPRRKKKKEKKSRYAGCIGLVPASDHGRSIIYASSRHTCCTSHFKNATDDLFGGMGVREIVCEWAQRAVARGAREVDGERQDEHHGLWPDRRRSRAQGILSRTSIKVIVVLRQLRGQSIVYKASLHAASPGSTPVFLSHTDLPEGHPQSLVWPVPWNGICTHYLSTTWLHIPWAQVALIHGQVGIESPPPFQACNARCETRITVTSWIGPVPASTQQQGARWDMDWRFWLFLVLTRRRLGETEEDCWTVSRASLAGDASHFADGRHWRL